MRNAAKVQRARGREFGRYLRRSFCPLQKKAERSEATIVLVRGPCERNGTLPTSAQRGTQPRV